MKDGDIDYSRYSPIELQEALDGINPKAFPQNYENLKVAYGLVFPNLAVAKKEASMANENKDKNAAWDFYFSSKASVASVVGAAAFLSNPDYYQYALISIPVAFSAYMTLKNRKSKMLHLAYYATVSLYSFVIGHFFFENHRLSNIGVIAIFIAIGAVFVLYAALHKYEKETAT